MVGAVRSQRILGKQCSYRMIRITEGVREGTSMSCQDNQRPQARRERGLSEELSITQMSRSSVEIIPFGNLHCSR